MKEKILKLTLAATLLSGCSGETKDTPRVPTPNTSTATPTQEPELPTDVPDKKEFTPFPTLDSKRTEVIIYQGIHPTKIIQNGEK